MEKQITDPWTGLFTQVFYDQTNNYIDFCVYTMLELYFMPAKLMSAGTEVDQWISTFSTNGIKLPNICRP